MMKKLKYTAPRICLGAQIFWLYTSSNFRVDILFILSHIAPDNYIFYCSDSYIRQVAVTAEKFVVMKQPRAYQCFRR